MMVFDLTGEQLCCQSGLECERYCSSRRACSKFVYGEFMTRVNVGVCREARVHGIDGMLSRDGAFIPATRINVTDRER